MQTSAHSQSKSRATQRRRDENGGDGLWVSPKILICVYSSGCFWDRNWFSSVAFVSANTISSKRVVCGWYAFGVK